MKLYSFNLDRNEYELFCTLIPTHQRAKIISDYIQNEYVIPEDISSLGLMNLYENRVSHPFRLKEVTNSKLNEFVTAIVKKEGISDNGLRSGIMRDVIAGLNKKYKDSPIVKSEKKDQIFHVQKGTIAKLSLFLEAYTRSSTITDFLFEQYVPGSKEEMKQCKPSTKESFRFQANLDTFELLDEIASNVGATRTDVFRHLIKQVVEFYYKQEESKEEELENQLKNILTEYKKIEDPNVIKEKVSEFLKK